MVAYSFKSFFAPQIVAGVKPQTVRGNRARHARPGEAVQLYVGMRTRHCRKIMPDPICTEVLSIEIQISTLIDELIASICIDGTFLHRDDIEQFARLDGFAPEHVNGLAPMLDGKSARANMGRFWLASDPEVTRFEGVLIKWRPQP